MFTFASSWVCLPKKAKLTARTPPSSPSKALSVSSPKVALNPSLAAIKGTSLPDFTGIQRPNQWLHWNKVSVKTRDAYLASNPRCLGVILSFLKEILNNVTFAAFNSLTNFGRYISPNSSTAVATFI